MTRLTLPAHLPARTPPDYGDGCRSKNFHMELAHTVGLNYTALYTAYDFCNFCQFKPLFQESLIFYLVKYNNIGN
jgi:hypothetical protein